MTDAEESDSLSNASSNNDEDGLANAMTEFAKKDWARQTEERIRDELEAEMKEQLHLLVSRYTRSKVKHDFLFS